MSQELIYTSARKGLRPGSRGFCTVVSTAGMGKTLADRLESLSGYRHHFTPHEAGQNPINYSHLRMTVGGTTYHVLSRVCDAGLDYTKRTNKLAHHVVLTAREAAQAIGGPGWVISQEDFLVESWDGNVRRVPESFRPVSKDACPAAKCTSWAELGVDPGWAGVLAQTATKKSQPMTVVFSSGVDTRSLVREALALVPQDQRWAVTFCTYFTKLPAGVDCLWRFVLDGTQEAAALRQNKRARTIDLCDASLGAAPDSELAELARTGIAPLMIEPGSAPPATARTRRDTRRRTAPPRSKRAGSSSLGDSIPLDFSDSPSSIRPAPVSHHPSRGKSNTLRNASLVFLMAMFLAAGMVVGAYLASRRSMDAANVASATDKGSAITPDAPAVEPPRGREEAYVPIDEPHEETLQTAENTNYGNEQEEPARQDEATAEAKAEEAVETSLSEVVPDTQFKPSRKPFDDVLRVQKRLSLPAHPSMGGASGFVELVKLFVGNQDCELELLGPDIDLRNGREIISPKTRTDGMTIKWIVQAKYDGSLVLPTEVGTFRLKNEVLEFRWADRPVDELDLHLCLLKITVDRETQTCSLNEPIEEPPVQVVFADESLPIELKLPENDKLRMDIAFAGFNGARVSVDGARPKAGQFVARGLEPQRTAVISLPFPRGRGNRKFVELKVQFEMSDENHGLKVRAFCFPYELTPNWDYTSQTPQFGDHEVALTDRGLATLEKNYRDQLEEVAENLTENEQLQKHLVGDAKIELDSTVDRLSQKVEDERVGLGRFALMQIYKENIRKTRAKYHQKVRKAKEQAGWIGRVEQNAQDNIAWCGDLKDFLRKLHDNGRIHFRVYIEVEDVEVDIVRSVGWDQLVLDSSQRNGEQ